MDPWPHTFVLVASGGGSLVERACACMATKLLRVATRAVGDTVLVHDSKADLWRRGVIAKLEEGGDGAVAMYHVAVGMRSYASPPSGVLVPSAGGIAAIMREAARAGSDGLVAALLELGVGIYESDLAATTALHAAAGAGQSTVCKLLTAAGADPYLEDAHQLSAYEEAVHSRSNEVRRLFRHEESDTDVQEAHDSLGSTGARDGILPASDGAPAADDAAAALLLVGLNCSGGSLWDNAVPEPDQEARALLGAALERIPDPEKAAAYINASAGRGGVVLLHLAARCGWLLGRACARANVRSPARATSARAGHAAPRAR